MTEIFIVRHGETIWNREGRTQGQKDVELSPSGRLQAHKAGIYLLKRTEKLNAVYSSDLIRAKETAQIIANFFGLKPVVDKRLREMHFGPWQGLTWKEISRLYPQESKIWLNNPTLLRLSGAETIEELLLRARGCIGELAVKNYGKKILVVSHGLLIKTLLCFLKGKPLDNLKEIKQCNTAINLVEFSEGKLRLIDCNCQEHLD